MEEHGPAFRMGYILMAAFAGAITALGFTRWKEMTRSEIALTFTIGFSFAIFVTPWLATAAFGIPDSNIRAVAALTYIFGSGSNILLPVIIRWVGRFFGGGEVGKNGPA